MPGGQGAASSRLSGGVGVCARRGGKLATGRADQEGVQRAALLGAQRAEGLVLDGGKPLLGRVQRRKSCRGELDDVAATIVGVAPGSDQAARLEVVEQPDQVARIQSECFAERLLGGGAVVAQQRQGNEVARS